MAARRKNQVSKTSPTSEKLFGNGALFVFPKESRAALETRIINHIRILDNVTLTVGRKLITAALKANKLKIQIGLETCRRCGSFEVQCECGGERVHPSDYGDHPRTPNDFYEGDDIRKLEPLLQSDHTILECTATLSYGDGGVTVEDNDDAESALDIIMENYREPELILYF
jgi:hypothetical protein